jgi:hypothetical protein
MYSFCREKPREQSEATNDHKIRSVAIELV